VQDGPDGQARGRGWDRACFAFVLLVWLACLVATQVFIAGYAARVPFADDLSAYFVKCSGASLWAHLWSLHNEHRLPLPKLVQGLLYDWTGDIRSGMYLEAQIYGAIALACILAARRFRGSSRPWDVLFPLMWLQLGNSNNLMMGFQIGVAIPGACAVTCLLCGALSPRRLQPSRALASGLALLALPLCGGGGLLQAPPLAVYSAWLGFRQRRAPDARERRGACLHLCFALATVALSALYLVGYQPPAQADYSPSSDNPPWKMAPAILCAPFGPDYSSWRPIAMPLIALGAALSALVIARRGLGQRDPRALGTLAVLAAGTLLVVGMGLGRPISGPLWIANRYIPMPAPFYVALALGGLVLLERRWRELPLALTCLVMLIALPGSIRHGRSEGELRSRDERELDRLVATRASWSTIHEFYSQHFVLGLSRLADMYLRYFAQVGLPPFDRGGRYEVPSRDNPSFDRPPSEIRCLEPPVNRKLDGKLLFLVAPPTTLVFAIGSADRSFTCVVGVPELLLRGGRHPGVGGRVLLRGAGAEPSLLGRIRLDPQHVEKDRGLQTLRYTWEPGFTGVLELEFEKLPRDEGPRASDRVGLCEARVE
jgi:hypothetical protein